MKKFVLICLIFLLCGCDEVQHIRAYKTPEGTIIRTGNAYYHITDKGLKSETYYRIGEPVRVEEVDRIITGSIRKGGESE